MNEQLLTELAELEGGFLHKALLNQRQEIIDTWTASNDERRDLLAKGEKRALDRLIHDIEAARETINKRRHGAERSPMSKSF